MNRTEKLAEIRHTLETFLRSWENADSQLLDSCSHRLPYFYMSMFGRTYSTFEVKQWFTQKPESLNLKLFMLGHSALIEGDKAQQYAPVIGIYTDKENGKNYAFAGGFANTLYNVNGEWKLETVRFDLKSDNFFFEDYLSHDDGVVRVPGKGDRELVSGWLFTDDRVGSFMDPIPGTSERQIVAEYDAPWYVIKNPDAFENDEDEIRDIFSRFVFAYDYNNFKLVDRVLSGNVKVYTPDLGELGKRDITTYLKEVRKGSPRTFIGYEFTKLAVEGNTADAVINTFAPEKMKNSGEKAEDFLSGRFAVKFTKENDEWRISAISYEEVK